MKVPDIYRRTDAVSKVVGVVLMVAITVVLAALVGSIALGFGDDVEKRPSASFDFDFDRNGTYDPDNTDLGAYRLDPPGAYISDNLTITHTGGDTIAAENLVVRIQGSGAKYIDDDGDLRDYGSGYYHRNYTFEKLSGRSEIASGHSVTLTTIYSDYSESSLSSPYNPGKMLRDASVAVVWRGEDTSVVIAEWEGPDA